MTDMVERVARALTMEEVKRKCGGSQSFKGRQKDFDKYVDMNWPERKDAARDALEVAFKVTDEDAQAFFGCRFASLNWSVRQQQRDFSVAMQALSDAALTEGS